LPAIAFSKISTLILDAAPSATVNVLGVASGTTAKVNLSGAGSTVVVGSALKQLLGAIQGTVAVNGTGTDTVAINDQNAPGISAYNVTASSVTDSNAVIQYVNVKSVLLNGGTASDVYNIESTASGTALTVQGGSGKDTFNISPAAKNLDHIQGNVSVEDKVGASVLNISDSSNSKAVTYSVTSTTVTRTGAATITYSSVSNLSLNGGTGSDIYNIESTPSSTAVSVKGASGKDTFNVDPAAQNLDNIKGNVSVEDIAGTNVLNIFDSKNANAVTYSVTSSTITRTGAAVLTYGSQAKVNLIGGSGNDTYNINGTPAGLQLALKAGIGNDTFNANANAPTSSVSVDGGLGNNKLVGPNVPGTWNINGVNAGKLGNVTFTAIQNLTGGSGLDVFVFSPGARVSGKIDGGGGGADWLDYAAYTTPVAVDLTANTATGAGGGIANIRNVRGGQDGNTLTGNSLGNILIGGAGTVSINGGTGRSILIADKGAGNINGRSGTDIMIGGITGYDIRSIANDIALGDILAEWQSGNNYATRILNITKGLGLTAGHMLRWMSEVQDNGVADVLTASPTPDPPVSPLVGDWFFQGAADTIKNKESYERIN
jgi:hypothetical protein